MAQQRIVSSIEESEDREFKLRTQILTALLRASKKDKTSSNEENLNEVLSLYGKWDEARLHEPRDENFARNVIYTMARISLLWRVRDSSAVARVLSCIFLRDSHFAILYWRHFDGLTHVVTVAGNIFKVASNEDEMSMQSLEFFLQHATKSKAVFLNNRFVDFPLPSPFNVSPAVLSLIQLRSRHLHLFLQHGGMLSPQPPRHDWKVSFSLKQFIFYTWIGVGRHLEEMDNLISLICLGQINRMLWNVANSFDEEELVEILNGRTFEDIKSCADVALKVIPQILPSDLEISSTHLDLFSSVEQTFLKMVQIDKHADWNAKAVEFIAKLRIMATQVSPLKHLCRCAVRNALRDNFQLPYGIAELPISEPLQQYLNLAESPP